MPRFGRPAMLAAALAFSLPLAGCGGGLFGGSDVAGPSGGGSPLANLMQFGTAAPPPVQQAPPEEVECPPVSIAAGGAALRLQAGQNAESVRGQVTITDVARECQPGAGGGVVMRVGAEGRVLVGPSGSAGPQGATLRIELRKGDQVLASRNARIGAVIPAGQAQAGWTHVEQGIVVPASAFTTSGDIDVFVTLNPAAAQPRRRR
jgi:hypothetical protein